MSFIIQVQIHQIHFIYHQTRITAAKEFYSFGPWSLVQILATSPRSEKNDLMLASSSRPR